MFHNGKKTIGVFLNRAEFDFQRNLCRALIESAERYDYNIAFMTSYEIRESENTYDVYGDIIVDFAPIEQFDAVVVALDTYDRATFRSRLVEALKSRATCPVVTFREKEDSFYGVLSNANESVRELVRHFKEVHKARNISFMSGFRDHYDSGRRLECYLNSMEEFGLPVYQNSVFYGDLWKNKGEEAFQYFFSDLSHRPDVVICANDFMARALCDAAAAHGVKVPQDLKVSGIDNAPESREIEPALTTVSADYQRMAAETIHLIDDLLHGRSREKYISVPSRIYYRESCGCLARNVVQSNQDRQNHYEQYAALMEEHTRNTYFKIDMAGCRNFGEMMNMICRNLPLIGNFDRFYLCLTGIHDMNGIPSFQRELPAEAEAVLRWENGEFQKTQSDPFPRQELLPYTAQENGPVSYYFTMLHDRASTFGYTAVSFRRPEDGIGMFYFDWNLTIALTINEYFAHQRIQALMQRNEKNSITDYLTQLNNRRGLARALKKNWPEWAAAHTEISFISVDLDGLKFINDHFGHEEGDRAICVISRTIQRIVPRGTVTARTGGDEFLILLMGGYAQAQHLEQQLEQELETLNHSNKGHFVVEASIGVYTTTIDAGISFQECMRQSDNEMYEKKRLRKKQRRS